MLHRDGQLGHDVQEGGTVLVDLLSQMVQRLAEGVRRRALGLGQVAAERHTGRGPGQVVIEVQSQQRLPVLLTVFLRRPGFGEVIHGFSSHARAWPGAYAHGAPVPIFRSPCRRRPPEAAERPSRKESFAVVSKNRGMTPVDSLP